MPPDDEGGRPGKGGPVAISDEVIDTNDSTASDVVADATAQSADLTVDEARALVGGIRQTIEVLKGEIAERDDELAVIAGQVFAAQQRFVTARTVAVEAYFEIGHCLERARGLMPSDQEYGEWFRKQKFGFSQQWSHVLRQAAQREIEVRAAVTTQVVTGQSPNIKKALQAVRNPDSPPRDPGKPRRNPLPQQANDAGSQLRKAMERMERIYSDDRFGANRQQIAASTRGELTYIVQAGQDLLDQLDDPRVNW